MKLPAILYEHHVARPGPYAASEVTGCGGTLRSRTVRINGKTLENRCVLHVTRTKSRNSQQRFMPCRPNMHRPVEEGSWPISNPLLEWRLALIGTGFFTPAFVHVISARVRRCTANVPSPLSPFQSGRFPCRRNLQGSGTRIVSLPEDRGNF